MHRKTNIMDKIVMEYLNKKGILKKKTKLKEARE